MIDYSFISQPIYKQCYEKKLETLMGRLGSLWDLRMGLRNHIGINRQAQAE